MSDRVSKPLTPAGRRVLAGALVLAGVLAAAPPSQAENVFLSAEHRIATLQSGIAPELYGATLLFAYRPERATRYAALRFRDDATLHVYSRQVQRAGTSEAFTLLLLSLDLSTMNLPADGKLAYRMVVDGVWTTDPANPRRELDPDTRLQWSVVEVDPRAVKPPRSPEWVDRGLARFQYAGPEGSSVALVGDFNRWDPYMHALTETTSGHYSIELRLPPGEHLYSFSVDGVWTADPLNPLRGIDREGRVVCIASPRR